MASPFQFIGPVPLLVSLKEVEFAGLVVTLIFIKTVSFGRFTIAAMFKNDLLLNKRILITGGGTGLGKAAAQRFLELGAEVYICGRREDTLAATEKELRGLLAQRGINAQ